MNKRLMASQGDFGIRVEGLGFYRDNGKENKNYYLGSRVWGLGLRA